MVERFTRGHGLRLALAFGCIYLIWGSTFFGIRVALEHLPPLFLCALRLLASGALLALVAWRTGAPRPRGAEWGNAALVGCLLPAIGNGSVTLGETHLASGLVALLVASIPMWMALFATLGPDRTPLRARVALGLVIGFTGIVWLVGRGATHASGGVIWALLPIAGSISWAWGSLWSRRVPMPSSPIVSSAVGMLAGGAGLLGASVAAGEGAHLTAASFGWAPMLALAYLAVFGSVISFTAYAWLLQQVPATRVSTYAFVNPIVAMALGALLAGEPLGGRVLIAAGLVVVAVALIVTTPVATAKPPARVATAPPGRSSESMPADPAA